jgi:hypothetical protein
MLGVVETECHSDECHSVECHSDEGHSAECRGAYDEHTVDKYRSKLESFSSEIS